MSIWKKIGAVVLILSMVTGCLSEDEATPAPDRSDAEAVVPPEPTPAPTEVLASSPYDRDDYDSGGWADFDGDCLDTRAEMLIEQSTEPAVVEGCSVVRGFWLDPYSGGVFTDPGDLHVDHTVSLADAHRSGADQWDNATKHEFANDTDNLIILAAATNISKSDQDASTYRPVFESQCLYAWTYAAVKQKWGLVVSEPQRVALAEMLATCDDPGSDGYEDQRPGLEPVSGVAEEVPAPTPVAATWEECHPAYVQCLPIVDDLNCSDVSGPIQVREIGVDPYRLDGDNSGSGCG